MHTRAHTRTHATHTHVGQCKVVQKLKSETRVQEQLSPQPQPRVTPGVRELLANGCFIGSERLRFIGSEQLQF